MKGVTSTTAITPKSSNTLTLTQPTLDSRINIEVRLLRFGFFSRGTSLFKRVIHKKSPKFCYLMKWDMFFQGATFIVIPKCSRGYVYSRGYAYSRV